MEITQKCKDEVDSSLKAAVRDLGIAKQELTRKLSSVTKLSLQAKCPHKNIVLRQGYLYDYLDCKDCGYEWQEF